MDRSVTPEDRQRFLSYRANINQFVSTVLGAGVIPREDYITGTERIHFHEDLLENASGLAIFDHRRPGEQLSHGIYEEALLQRLLNSTSTMLVVIGGLGAGKSTAVRYLVDTIAAREAELATTHACQCAPCVRRPIVINCIDLDRTLSSNECEAEVLMRIRRELYIRLIDEWYVHHGLDPAALTHANRKVLRRLLIANDIYHWADAETIDFPTSLHTPELALADDLLARSPSDWQIDDLTHSFMKFSDALDRPVQDASVDIGIAKRFTALVLSFWLKSCNSSSPKNLIVIDNLDQQPTDHIEQIVNHLYDLSARTAGVRFLVPLRPSSIVPHGFTHNPDYMYHYGPNCYELVYQRLAKYVLLRSRAELTATRAAAGLFATSPTEDEINALLIVAYVYAWLCVTGMRQAADDDARPAVHDDHQFLEHLHVSSAVRTQLSETLGAIVGTCGRYATEQLRRYFQHVYAKPFFVRTALNSIAQRSPSTTLKLPYGQIVTALLGAADGDANITGLANLYTPTEFRSNKTMPTLAKLRVLALLADWPRIKVKAVVRELAQNGIPAEIAIDALNYLHNKNRLLLWFSRNSDLRVDQPDLDQYVVLSEHGEAYLKNLIGDFEYVWYCAQRLVSSATWDESDVFRGRLADYKRLVSDFARTEWKQMTFRRCASSAVWKPPTPEIRGEEMLSLFVLYSSLDRALGGARVVVRHRDNEYTEEVVEAIEALALLVLEKQDAYEIYFGDNGYRVAYAARIAACYDAVKTLVAIDAFLNIRATLELLLDSWSGPLRHFKPFNEDLGAVRAGTPPDVWTDYVAGMPLAPLRPAEHHAREVLGALLRHVIHRRKMLAELLARRYPTFGIIDHNVALLIEEMALARESVDRLAASSRTLSDWLHLERTNLRDILHELRANAFTVPDVCVMAEMDDLKRRANNISNAYVTLARRLGTDRTEHLAVYWAFQRDSSLPVRVEDR